MSRLSGRLRSGSVRLACEALAEADCSGAKSSWMGDVGHGVSTAGPDDSDSSDSLHCKLYSPSSLANGLRNHDDQFQRRAKKRRQMEHVEQMLMHKQMHIQQHPHQHVHHQTHSPEQQKSENPNTHLQSQTHIQIDTQVCTGQNVLTQKHKNVEMDKSQIIEENVSLVPEDLSITSKNKEYTSCVLSPHPLHTTQLSQNYLTQLPSPASTFKVNTDPLPTNTNKPETGSLSSPEVCQSFGAGQNPENTSMEAERKYTLRSSGRPRFPCHLRKSSRLRRNAEDVSIKEEEFKEEEQGISNLWKVNEVRPKVEQPPKVVGAEASLVTLPDSLKSTTSIKNYNVGMTFVSEYNTVTQSSVRSKPQGRFLGVRKIVVKIARIPVQLGRRQKSYKISSLEPMVAQSHSEQNIGSEGSEGGISGEVIANVVKEPTALLRMKNNGKSVMVMFPPGELPVILKRRRGRPPKQALPGQPDMRETKAGAASAAEPKKPRRRRRVKLPPPLPSYVNDTNDVKVEYADVLSKMAFLNRQPPSTGRCSPPRCWTPTEPETFHTSQENPKLSTLLHRLTGFRKRGGRAGCMGGRGGGLAGSSDAFKRSFSDFFETIGKKRKVPQSELGTPKKRGKGISAGIKRTTLSELSPGNSVSGEKIRKRRTRKNGDLKVGQGVQDQDWNVNCGWREKGDPNTPEYAGSYQGCYSPRGGFVSTETGKRRVYHSPGVRGAESGEECQGMFAGYFRSLLDSDDSTDLLDISLSSPTGHQDPLKFTAGYEGSSPGAAHCWSPAFSKRSPKIHACTGEGARLASPQMHSSSANRYSYTISQTSPTVTYTKSPALSISRSPSSPHPSSVFSQYPTTYSGTVQQGLQQQHRLSDCSFTYGSKVSPAPSTQRQITYSSYQTSAKCNYSGYPGHSNSPMQPGESGPASPGGNYMSISKSSFFSSSSPSEGSRLYQSPTTWGYRHGGTGWGGDGLGTNQFHGYSDYGIAGSNSESKDILDISNYTPQKAKQRTCPDTFSESSSDSSHTGVGSMGAVYCPRDVPVPEGQSSLSSLEKLMLDWNENSAGPSYNWSQNVLFQGGTKSGRGRKKKSELRSERELGYMPPGSPASPPMQSSVSKRSPSVSRQPRGGRGRGGFSPCQRERPLSLKSKLQKSTTGQITSTSGLYQETLDYYSGDSSSLSPLSHAPESCEYPSPYSVHTSTPSSDEKFVHTYPSDSASLSPSLSSQSDSLKQHSKPTPQSYGHVSRTFSPTLSSGSRLMPQGGSAMSPHCVSKDQLSQYDSPSYSNSPCWYGQSGSVAHSPQSFDEMRSNKAALASNKRDMALMVSGIRSASHSPYPTSVSRGNAISSCTSGTQDSSPQHEELGYQGNTDNFAPLGHRFVYQGARGGVLCQLLDQPNEESFTVTSL